MKSTLNLPKPLCTKAFPAIWVRVAEKNKKIQKLGIEKCRFAMSETASLVGQNGISRKMLFRHLHHIIEGELARED